MDLPSTLAELRLEPGRLQARQKALAQRVASLGAAQWAAHAAGRAAALSASSALSAGAAAEVSLLDARRSAGRVAEVLEESAVRARRSADAYARLQRAAREQANVVELLEAPAIAETAARNGLFDEALVLAEFANTLYRRHGLATWRAGATRPAGGDDAGSGADEVEGSAAGIEGDGEGAGEEEGAGGGARVLLHGVVTDIRQALVGVQEQLQLQLRSKVRAVVIARAYAELRLILAFIRVIVDRYRYRGA